MALKKISIIISLFSSLIVFSQETKVSNRILTYGYPYHTGIKVMEFIGAKWDIEIYPVAGCTVFQELLDSVAQVHKSLWERMDSIHGKGSKERFEKTYTTELKKIDELKKYIQGNKEMKKVFRKLRVLEKRMFIDFNGYSIDGLYYNFTVFRNKKYPYPQWVKKLDLSINYTTKEIKTTVIN